MDELLFILLASNSFDRQHKAQRHVFLKLFSADIEIGEV